LAMSFKVILIINHIVGQGLSSKIAKSLKDYKIAIIN